MDWNGDRRKGYCKIIEPYVCTMCQKREDRILLRRELTNYKPRDFFDYAEKLKEEHAYMLKPEAEVMDMVNDAMMVDRQKLKFWDSLHAPEAPTEKEEFEFKIPSRNNNAS
jgi:phosphoketolase